MPPDPILVARNIGPAELLEYGRKLKGVVLDEGSVGSHAAIVARAWAIPLVIHADRITAEALNGDQILVDGDQGIVHLRPEETSCPRLPRQDGDAGRGAEALRQAARPAGGGEVRLGRRAAHERGPDGGPAVARRLGGRGRRALPDRAAVPVRNKVPRRGELAALYARVMDAAKGKRVVFRTLDIGSDKVLPYMKPRGRAEPGHGLAGDPRRARQAGRSADAASGADPRGQRAPADGHVPLRGADGGIQAARSTCSTRSSASVAWAHPVPDGSRSARCWRRRASPSRPRLLRDGPTSCRVGGNDLKQFFFAADRENERVRKRYDTLNVGYLDFLGQIVARCDEAGTPVSFCGEDAGRPVEAVCLAAMGLRTLSMRPASIGPVKHLLRRVSLVEARAVIDAAREAGVQSVRPAVMDWLRSLG
jgi:phosphotransferase system, enzyme I, PtsP